MIRQLGQREQPEDTHEQLSKVSRTIAWNLVIRGVDVMKLRWIASSINPERDSPSNIPAKMQSALQMSIFLS